MIALRRCPVCDDVLHGGAFCERCRRYSDSLAYADTLVDAPLVLSPADQLSIIAATAPRSHRPSREERAISRARAAGVLLAGEER